MCRWLLWICPPIHSCPPVICPSRAERWTQLKMGFWKILILNDPFCWEGCAHGKVLLLADSSGFQQSYQAAPHTYTKLDTRQNRHHQVSFRDATNCPQLLPSAGRMKTGNRHCLQRRKNVSNLLSALPLAHLFHIWDVVTEVVVFLAVHSLELW